MLHLNALRLLQLIRQTRPPWGLFGIALFMSLLTTLASLAIPFLTSRFIDNFSFSDLSRELIALLAVALVLQAAGSGLSVYLLAKVGQHVVASLRERLWEQLLHLPVTFYDERQTGDSVSRMTNDTALIKNLVTDHLIGFLTGIVALVGTIIVLFVLDWPLAIVMLSVVPLSLAILVPVGIRMARISKGLQKETAAFSASLTRVLSEIRLVKASNAERVEATRGRQHIHELFRFGMKEGVMSALMAPLLSTTIIGVLMLVIGFGGYRVSIGAMTAGTLVAFFIYLFQIIQPLAQIGTFFTQFQKASGATEQVLTILQAEPEKLDVGEASVNGRGLLAVEQLGFCYPGTETAVLQGISFTVTPGTVTAIVGPSGSGKSTLFALLERFYEPNEGVIRYEGKPIGQLALRQWRSLIGYVAQDSPVNYGTIRDNLCYGLDRQVSDEELINAARMAYADLFIRELPQGYDTEVGERGIKLSGGQRQRIAIARALLRDPVILMLDEATSSLDSQSELYVQQALANLMRGRTTLVIAHRLSTVVHANQIIVLEHGEITGRGTHDTLFNEHALYRELAEQQLVQPAIV